MNSGKDTNINVIVYAFKIIWMSIRHPTRFWRMTMIFHTMVNHGVTCDDEEIMRIIDTCLFGRKYGDQYETNHSGFKVFK